MRFKSLFKVVCVPDVDNKTKPIYNERDPWPQMINLLTTRSSENDNDSR